MKEKYQGALCMVLSALSFATMQILIAVSAGAIPLFEQLFFRNLVAALLTLIGLCRNHVNPLGKPENRKILILRSASGYLGMMALFYASAHAAQGDVAILNKMSPFVVTLLAAIFLGQTVKRYHVLALVCAFAGAVLVSGPTFRSNFFPIFVAMLSALFTGVAYTSVSALRGRENPNVIIFFFSAFSTILSAIIMSFHFVMPTPLQMLELLGIAACASAGQFLLTRSYTMIPASEASIFNYSGIIFSTLLGYLLLKQKIAPTSYLGGALVLAAGAIVFLGQRKELRK